MNSLLFGISISAVLSLASLFIVLLRVSPLTAPTQAIPAFFISLLLSVGTVGTLLFYALWRFLPLHLWDTGKLVSIALRQGILLAIATVLIVLFHLWGLLTWWIAVMIYAIFALIELALEH